MVTNQILQNVYFWFYKPRESLKDKSSSSAKINLIHHCLGIYTLSCLPSDIKDACCPLHNPSVGPIRSPTKRTGQKQVPDLSFLTTVPKLAYLLLLQFPCFSYIVSVLLNTCPFLQ